MAIWPGIVISLAVFSFNMFGDALATCWILDSGESRVASGSVQQLRELPQVLVFTRVISVSGAA
jgi:hypothetical protein